MSVKEAVNRFKNRIGSLFPTDMGRIHEDLKRLIAERDDAKRYVSLLTRGEWTLLRLETNRRVEDLTQLVCRFAVDPKKYETQLIDASARRDELTKFLDRVEGSPDRLEKLTKQINELYEITRSNPT